MYGGVCGVCGHVQSDRRVGTKPIGTSTSVTDAAVAGAAASRGAAVPREDTMAGGSI